MSSWTFVASSISFVWITKVHCIKTWFFRCAIVVCLRLKLSIFPQNVYFFLLIYFIALPDVSAEFEYEIPSSILALPDSGIPFVRKVKEIKSMSNMQVDRANFGGGVPTFKANQKMQYKAFVDGEQIYDMDITIDQNSRRTVPHDPQRSKHLLVMGCSFVFGLGLQDHETLPVFLSHLQGGYNVYNMGFPSYSPSELWLRARHGDLFNGVQEREGVALMVFIPNTFFRTINGMSMVGNRWGARLSRYVEVDEEGNVRDMGLYAKVFPITAWIYSILAKSHFFKLLNIDFPILFEEHYEKNVKVLKALKEEYTKHFGAKSKFIVMLYPRSGYSFDTHRFKSMLNKEEIYFIDYSVVDLQEKMREPSHLNYDPHPTKEANRQLSQLLVKDLSLLTSSP